MRINYTEEEDFPGQFNLWQGNCRRSLRGKAGQQALRRLLAALEAMPEKRLIARALENPKTGDVCALGAVGRLEGKLPESDLTESQLEDVDDDWEENESDAEEFGESVLKFPRLVAWKVVEMNDITIDGEYRICEGPVKPYSYYSQTHYRNEGVRQFFPVTPEQRYERMLAWVRAQLVGHVESLNSAKPELDR